MMLLGVGLILQSTALVCILPFVQMEQGARDMSPVAVNCSKIQELEEGTERLQLHDVVGRQGNVSSNSPSYS